MGVLATIFIGLCIGIVAKLLLPGKDPGGLIITTLLGIGGALLAAYLGQALGMYRAGEPPGFIGAVAGAVVILLLHRLIVRNK